MTIPPHIWDAYWSDVKPGTEAALERVVAAMALPPTAFEWTPAMCALWSQPMRPTMSGLLAIWEAMREAAVYGTPRPLAEPDADGWIEWHGGTLPWQYRTGQRVETKHRGGDVYTDKQAWEWQMWPNGFWEHEEDYTDIVAYRVVS